MSAFDHAFFEIWTNRDVAIHEALAKHGRNRFACEYANQTLKLWEAYCAEKGDGWELPRYDRRKPSPHAQPVCMRCFDTGWEYLGPYRVARCDHRGGRILYASKGGHIQR